MQHPAIDAVGQVLAQLAVLAHHPRRNGVGMAVAHIGDEHIGAFAADLLDMMAPVAQALEQFGRWLAGADGKIAFQQFQRHPVPVVGNPLARDQTAQIGDRLLDDLVGTEPVAALAPTFDDLGQGLFQIVEPLAANRHHGHHRTAERLGQGIHIDDLAALARHIHHVQRQHHRHAHFQQLHGQVEIAFEVGGINHIDHRLGLAGKQVVARDPLVQRQGVEGIDARKIDQRGRLAGRLQTELPLLALDGHAGPVAGGLTDAGQRIEQRGLAAIRVAGDGDGGHAAALPETGSGDGDGATWIAAAISGPSAIRLP